MCGPTPMEAHMQAFTHATGSWWVTRSIRRHANAARPRRIAALFARITKRFPRTEDDIADRYSGCGWGDETERRLLDDVLNRQRGGFFR
jgi:hypothetical protein